jgi:hypothetical protein
MRTKALILSVMIGAAGVVSSIAADNVYSVNVVGYINMTLSNSWSLVSDQLDDGAGNKITNVFSADFGAGKYPVTFYKYNGATYDTLTRVSAAVWTFNPNTVENRQATLKPGEAIFVRKQFAAPISVTFVGEVKQGDNMTNSIVSPGFELYSPIIPQDGGVRTIHNLTPPANSVVYAGFNGVSYTTIRNWTGTVWAGAEPQIKVGEGFWLNSRGTAAFDWTRTFWVNN